MHALALVRVARVALPLVLLAGCVGGSGCGVAPTAVEAPVASAPRPAETALRPCPVDATGSCSAKEANEPVGSGERRDVAVLRTDPVRGAKDAKVTLVVFSDFQCPYCERFESTLEELLELYPEKLRIVWKDYPLDMHPQARPAALLARLAHERGGDELFWQVHDDLFDAQTDFDGGALEEIAREHELDWPPPARVAPLVDASLTQARSLGVVSTPTSFVNGRVIVGSQPLQTYTALVDEELAQLEPPAAR